MKEYCEMSLVQSAHCYLIFMNLESLLKRNRYIVYRKCMENESMIIYK